MSAPTTARSKNDERLNGNLMKEMGSKKGYDPIPPPQHQWQQAPGEAPLHRVWSWMCAHTIHWGHRCAYAISKGGDELHLEHIADDLNMDVHNVRRVWREGMRKGLWRNGTRAEGNRRLYLNGELKPVEVKEPPEPEPDAEAGPNDETDETQTGEETANGGVCTDPKLPPYILEQINKLPRAERKRFWKEHNADVQLQKLALKEVVSGIRTVFTQREDIRYQQYAVKKIRQVHEAKKAKLDPEVEAARAERLEAILPSISGFVQTLFEFVQTPETSLYKPFSDSVQSPSAHPYLIEERLPEKAALEASSSILNAAHGPEAAPHRDGQKSLNQLPAPAKPNGAANHAANGKKPAQKPTRAELEATRQEVEQLGQALRIELPAAERILAGCRAVDLKISVWEVAELANFKIKQVKNQIDKGKIDNVPGWLMTALPKTVLGAPRETARERAIKNVEKQLYYARLVVEDAERGEATAEDRDRELASIANLQSNLDMMLATAGRAAKGAAS